MLDETFDLIKKRETVFEQKSLLTLHISDRPTEKCVCVFVEYIPVVCSRTASQLTTEASLSHRLMVNVQIMYRYTVGVHA